MTENLTLYHGGSGEFLEQAISGQVPLVGKRVLDDPSLSATLTNDRYFAVEWAVRKRGRNPVLLTYSVPDSLLIDEGLLAFKEFAQGYATTLEIGLEAIPQIYLQALINYNYFFDNERIAALVKMGKLSFHEIPYEYLQSVSYLDSRTK